MEQNETGCQAPPEAPKLCANNCGFFGSAATMNLCSKCHKDLVLNQEQSQQAESIINGAQNSSGKEPLLTTSNTQSVLPETMVVPTQELCTSLTSKEEKAKDSPTPTRCSTCRKRVGLTGFDCRCGNLFCAVHRYSDKHDCPYDYRSAAQDAIARANPVVKAEKVDKI